MAENLAEMIKSCAYQRNLRRLGNAASDFSSQIKVAPRMTELIGVERFIIVISKDNVDFSFYESKNVRRNAKSILDRMPTQSGKRTRYRGTVSDE